jgi:muconolactone D-isomerase
MTEIHNPNRVLAILTINTTQLPENFPEIVKHEQEVVQQWKEEGILEQLYLRPTRNGAVFIFKNLDEAAVQERMKTLPLYPLQESIVYYPLLEQFH